MDKAIIIENINTLDQELKYWLNHYAATHFDSTTVYKEWLHKSDQEKKEIFGLISQAKALVFKSTLSNEKQNIQFLSTLLKLDNPPDVLVFSDNRLMDVLNRNLRGNKSRDLIIEFVKKNPGKLIEVGSIRVTKEGKPSYFGDSGYFDFNYSEIVYPPGIDWFLWASFVDKNYTEIKNQICEHFKDSWAPEYIGLGDQNIKDIIETLKSTPIKWN